MTSPRALSLLAGLAAPVFLVAAVAGWVSGLWPATPLTFGLAALVVTGGPLLAMLHVMTAAPEPEELDEPEAPTRVLPRPVAAPAPVPLPLTPKAAAARAFLGWRDSGT